MQLGLCTWSTIYYSWVCAFDQPFMIAGLVHLISHSAFCGNIAKLAVDITAWFFFYVYSISYTQYTCITVLWQIVYVCSRYVWHAGGFTVWDQYSIVMLWCGSGQTAKAFHASLQRAAVLCSSCRGASVLSRCYLVQAVKYDLIWAQRLSLGIFIDVF